MMASNPVAMPRAADGAGPSFEASRSWPRGRREPILRGPDRPEHEAFEINQVDRGVDRRQFGDVGLEAVRRLRECRVAADSISGTMQPNNTASDNVVSSLHPEE